MNRFRPTFRLLRSVFCNKRVAQAILLILLLASNAIADEFLDRIRALPGVAAANEAVSTIPGTRFFVIRFRQPVDHYNPSGPRFLQRMTLLHRSETLPMVFALNGYNISTTSGQRELTAYLQSNELHVEHRYFPPSVPKPVSWKYLTIEQSAADHHAIVESFKSIYSRKWISTGASKGGMTSIYHRYFYPEDVYATVPYVAPSSHGVSDPRYIPFVATRGTPDCRARLQDFQRAVLTRRAEMLPLMTAGTFSIFGKDKALEFAVLEMPFTFWQYFDASYCDRIPQPNAPTTELFAFLDEIAVLSFYGDQILRRYMPYYYQAATELGAPAIDESYLMPLLNYPGQDVPTNYPPLLVEKTFDPLRMLQIERWVQTSGRRFILIYGQNDPWSTGAFRVAPTNDSYRRVVTGLAGNHGANITRLPPLKRAFVLAKIAQWMDSPVLPSLHPERLRTDPLSFEPPSRLELFLR